MSADNGENSQSHIEPAKTHQSGSGQGEALPPSSSPGDAAQDSTAAQGGAPGGTAPGGVVVASGGQNGTVDSAPSGAVHEGARQSAPVQPGGKPANPVGGIGPAAMITAIVLIVVYIVMVFILIRLRGDANWDRLSYLLSGFEALVFAGAGALFGTTIQRANVNAARSDATDAKNEATAAKQTAQTQSDRAQKAEKDAVAGRFLAAAVKVKADTHASDGSGQAPVAADQRRGSRPDLDREAALTRPVSPDPDLAELSALARAILPD